MLRISLVFILVVMTVFPAVMQGDETSTALSIGQIAFVSNIDGNAEIYVMNADGTNQRRLTNDPDHNVQPSWSPDGTQIAFYSVRDGSYSLNVMNADGNQQSRIADNVELSQAGPVWSPDGMQIAFTSKREDLYDIHVIGADGTGERQLTKDGDSNDPAWSPDGTSIAFRAYQGGVYVMNTDGKRRRLIADPGGGEFDPVWSPDSQRIAFVAAAGDGGWIYMVNADGTDLHLWNGASASPSWSPDGTQIAFYYFVDSYGIYVKNADGTRLLRLTDNPSSDDVPMWSPDGTQIVFTSDRDRFNKIYVINADGTNLQQLTQVSGYSPVWQPLTPGNSPAKPLSTQAVSPETTGSPPDPGQIAFVSKREGTNDLYTMNADGMNVRRLADNVVISWDWIPSDSEWMPSKGLFAWSPDGAHLAFVSDRDYYPDIYMMDANGTNIRPLTKNRTNRVSYFDLLWSPDGARLAFVSKKSSSDEYSLSLMSVNKGRIEIEHLSKTLTEYTSLAWSPDGTQIAFVSGSHLDAPDGSLYMIDIETTRVRRLTNILAEYKDLVWSPDGTSIAFTSSQDGNHDIYVMSADGTNQRALTNTPEDEDAPAWSPDGTEIAFSVKEAIYVMRADGTDGHLLADTTLPDMLPVWSADGSQILFGAFYEYASDMYLVNADGTHLRRLIDNAIYNASSTWRPMP